MTKAEEAVAVPQLEWYDHHVLVVTVGRYLVRQGWNAQALQWFYEQPHRYQREYERYCREVRTGG